jgi:hypothetical protein
LSRDEYGIFHVNCKHCGHAFEIGCPDEKVYVRILDKPCPRRDSIELNNYCPSCEKPNTIIWDMNHELPFKRDKNDDLKFAGQP